jgi:hypothetical protein
MVIGLFNQPGRHDLTTPQISQTQATTPSPRESQRYAVNLIENSLAMRKVADPVDISGQAYEVDRVVMMLMKWRQPWAIFLGARLSLASFLNQIGSRF